MLSFLTCSLINCVLSCVMKSKGANNIRQLVSKEVSKRELISQILFCAISRSVQKRDSWDKEPKYPIPLVYLPIYQRVMAPVIKILQITHFFNCKHLIPLLL